MEKDYSKRELDMKFDEVKQSFSDQNIILNEIKIQVKTTNGRVSALEKAKWIVYGFCICISIVLLPLLFSLIQVGKI